MPPESSGCASIPEDTARSIVCVRSGFVKSAAARSSARSRFAASKRVRMQDFRSSNGSRMRTQIIPFPETANEASEFLRRLAESQRRMRPGSVYRVQFNRRLPLYGWNQADSLPAKAWNHDALLFADSRGAGWQLHGYDITDHSRINPRLVARMNCSSCLNCLTQRHGPSAGCSSEPHGRGLGTNPWWQDVLENGRASEYANFFRYRLESAEA